MSARLLAVCTGATQQHDLDGRATATAIDKRAQPGAHHLDVHGLTSDEQADREHHGGPDQALYAYGQDDADHWAAALHRDLPPGSFGENLRIAGIDVSDARIGERWRIGSDVEVAVTAPRIPCRVFAGFWEVPDLVERFLSAGRPGAYLRVVRPGPIEAGLRVRVAARPTHGVSVADVLRIRTRDQRESDQLLQLDGLATRLREWASGRQR